MTTSAMRQTARPVPDPTILTTQQLQREVLLLRELIEKEVECLRDAVNRDRVETGRLSDMIDEKITWLRGVHEEKFAGIKNQFEERDVRAAQAVTTNNLAINTAFSAAKETVGEQNRSSALSIAKSETSTTKEIDRLGQLIGQNTKNLEDKISDIKDRLTMLEGRQSGVNMAWAAIIVVITLLLSAAGVISALVVKH